MSTTRKRNRVPKSCSICHARKIKCDRSRPACEICVKRNVAHLCQYEEPKWATEQMTSIGGVEVTQKSVLDDYNSTRLKDKSITDNPYHSAARIPIAFIPSINEDHDHNTKRKLPLEPPLKRLKTNDDVESLQAQISSLKNLVSELTSTIQNSNRDIEGNYLSPQSLGISDSPVGDTLLNVNREETIDFYFNSSAIAIRKSRVMYHGPFSQYALMKRDEFVHIGWWTINDKANKKKRLKNVFGIEVVPESSKREVVPLSLSVEDMKITLQRQIQNLLPDQKVIWLLIDRFFSSVYPFYPYMIKDEFIEKVTNVIGLRSLSEIPVTIELKKRGDFATIGVLLIVLRMGYLSILNNKPPEDYQTSERFMYDYLAANPVSFNLITLAQLCLNQFRILRKADLSTFQLALYLRIYNRFSPEYDGNTDTFDMQIFTGLLFQIAFAIGLHEDPSGLEPRHAHLRRKIWYCLQSLDLEESVSTGVPLRIDSVENNVKLPEFVQERPGSYEDILENRIIRLMHDDWSSKQVVREIVKDVISFKGTKVDVLLNKLQILEKHTFDKYHSLQSIINSKDIVDDITRCYMIRRYISIKSMLATLNYHLMLHYEEIDDFKNAKHYFFILLGLNADIIANFDFRAEGPQILRCGNEFIWASVQSLMVVSFIFQFSLYLRCQFMSLNNPTEVDLQLQLDTIKSNLLQNMMSCIYAESKYCKTHYTSWRFVCSCLNIVRRVEQSAGFFFKDEHGTVSAPKASTDIAIPTKNLVSDLDPEQLQKFQQLTDRERYRTSLANNKLDDYKTVLQNSQSYFDDIINDDTWSKQSLRKTNNRFYANLSNHNISYDNLNDEFGIDDIFNDLIDF